MERNGVIFDKETELFETKKSKYYISLTIIALLVILGLAYFFNIYPGGYSIETDNDKVVIEKGIILTKSFNYTVTITNELKLGLLEIYINELKTKWYLYSILVAMNTILLFGNFRSKYGKTITLSIFITLLILLSISVILDINQIEGIITSLEQTK